MLTWIGIALFVVLPAAGVLWMLWSIWLEYRGDRIPILLYHRLIRKTDADAGRVRDDEMMWVSYDNRFAEQMQYLQEKGYTTLDLDDYLRIRSGEAELPKRAVVITFDDGYLSNYTLAFPAMKALGQKATIFVAPEPDDHTRNAVRGVDDFLTDEQMREMASHGISIQSHTLTHCVLSELDDESARRELQESQRRLQEITKRPVQHIAIPRAGYSRRIRRLVAEAGYRTACCNNKGTSNGLSDPLALPRIVIERDMSLDDFARYLGPRSSAVLRIVGNIKRIPERLGGARFATRLRNRLYRSRLRALFETRNLKLMIGAVLLTYLLMGVIFAWRLIGGV